MTSREIDDFIRKNHTKLDDKTLATSVGLSLVALQRRRQRLDIKRPVAKKSLEEEIGQHLARKEGKTESRRFDKLLSAHQRLQREFDAVTTLSTSQPRTRAIRAPGGKKGGEATIVALLSDTHLEETVKPENTNGLGRYSVEIAESRFDQYFRVLLHLIELEQKNTRIDNLVLALLGDFISGDIHDELLETCSLQPIDAILKAQDCIASGLDYLLKNSKLRITLVCHSGNHARTTKKTRHTTEPGHSLEFFMFNNLRRLYRHEKRLTWLIPESYLSYMTVYDMRIAFHHGHNVRYGGGVGGISISMNKAISQWNRARRADIYVCGHFHSVYDGGQFIVNGSMIGYNAFAVAIKAAYEPPAQVLFAIHSKLGKYMTRYILFDEAAAS